MAQTENKSLEVWQSTEIARKTDSGPDFSVIYKKKRTAKSSFSKVSFFEGFVEILTDDRITKLLVAMWDLVDEQKVDPNQLVDFLRSTGFDNEIGLARRLLNDYQGHRSEF